MKTPSSRSALVALLAACTFFLPAILRASTVIQSITVQFNTLEDDKAANSGISVFIQNAAGQVVAGTYDFAKMAFPQKTTSAEFPVNYKAGPQTTDALSGFKVTVQMQSPAGKTDNWVFNYVIRLKLADGTVIKRQASTCQLKSVSGGAASVSRELHY